MWTRSIFALCLATLLTILTAIGCGGGDLVIGGSQPVVPTAASQTPTPTCGQVGVACSFGSDCCSLSCDVVNSACL